LNGARLIEIKTIDFVITTNYSPYFKSELLLKKTIKSLNLIQDLMNSFIEYRIIIAIDGLDPTFHSLKKNYKKFIENVISLKNDRVVISDCELGGVGAT